MNHKVFQRAVLLLRRFHSSLHSIFMVQNLMSAFNKNLFWRGHQVSFARKETNKPLELASK
jgi:hypothetical protein